MKEKAKTLASKSQLDIALDIADRNTGKIKKYFKRLI